MNTPAFDSNNIKQFDEPANLLKALSHPIRLCIVRGLMMKKNVMFLICRNVWIFPNQQSHNTSRSFVVQVLLLRSGMDLK